MRARPTTQSSKLSFSCQLPSIFTVSLFLSLSLPAVYRSSDKNHEVDDGGVGDDDVDTGKSLARGARRVERRPYEPAVIMEIVFPHKRSNK